MVTVEIYSRPGCHLCDVAKETIEKVRKRVAFDLRITNVESDPALETAFGQEIPVVMINGQKAFKYRVEESEFENKVKRLWKP
jgi:glutaredoxin